MIKAIEHGLPIITAAYGMGAEDSGCRLGPPTLKNSLLAASAELKLNWEELAIEQTDLTKLAALPAIAEICNRLAETTCRYTQQRQPFAVIGGDHSCAIGTWSGVATALQQEGAMGLLWIDAHMDSHTPESSFSKNIHGMPVASLLGYGQATLTQILSVHPKLKPEHLCLIGIRSFEQAEAELLARLKVRVYTMDEIRQRGLDTVTQEALRIVQTGTVGYGLSIDLDALDPIDAPGVGTPEPMGIRVAEFYQALDIIFKNTGLLGLEIVEFNPNHDQQQQTEKIIYTVLGKFAKYIKLPSCITS